MLLHPVNVPLYNQYACNQYSSNYSVFLYSINAPIRTILHHPINALSCYQCSSLQPILLQSINQYSLIQSMTLHPIKIPASIQYYYTQSMPLPSNQFFSIHQCFSIWPIPSIQPILVYPINGSPCNRCQSHMPAPPFNQYLSIQSLLLHSTNTPPSNQCPFIQPIFLHPTNIPSSTNSFQYN